MNNRSVSPVLTTAGYVAPVLPRALSTYMHPAAQYLRERIADLQAVYLFGSQASAEASPRSDVDLALLAERPLNAARRWRLQEELASLLRRDVDLVDLRSASTVMRVQVIDRGLVIADVQQNARELFEAIALSDYARLNEERKAIIEDIRERGSVYG